MLYTPLQPQYSCLYTYTYMYIPHIYSSLYTPPYTPLLYTPILKTPIHLTGRRYGRVPDQTRVEIQRHEYTDTILYYRYTILNIICACEAIICMFTIYDVYVLYMIWWVCYNRYECNNAQPGIIHISLL